MLTPLSLTRSHSFENMQKTSPCSSSTTVSPGLNVEGKKLTGILEIVEQYGIKAVLFDFDNTIADTTLHHYSAWANACKEIGVKFFSFKDYYHKYNGFNSCIAIAKLSELRGYQLNTSQVNALIERKNMLFHESLSDIKPFPKIVEIIGKLKETKGVSLVIVTGSSTSEIEKILKNESFSNISTSFQSIIGQDTKITDPATGQLRALISKPSPEPYRLGKSRVEEQRGDALMNRDCLVVEDAFVGIVSGLRNYSGDNGSFDCMMTFNIHQLIDSPELINQMMISGAKIQRAAGIAD